MATLTELKQQQTDAGAAYAAAAAAYVAAFEELHAIDLAIGNGNVGEGHQPTFNIRPAVIPHPRFLPHDAANALCASQNGEAVANRLNQLLASYEPG